MQLPSDGSPPGSLTYNAVRTMDVGATVAAILL